MLQIIQLSKNSGGGTFDVIMTDPPYNVNYKGGTDKKLQMVNDNMNDISFLEFLTKAFTNLAEGLKDGGAFYVWYASREHINFETALNKAGLTVRQQIIWAKNTFVLGRQDYQWQHEPCMYGWKDGAPHYFVDNRTNSTLQESERPENIKKLKKQELVEFCEKLMSQFEGVSTTIERENKPAANEQHPTMKPVRLIARLLANSTKRGDTVADGFGGSGSTVIACEQLGLKCKIVEISPTYASYTVDRWEKFTGKTAVRIA